MGGKAGVLAACVRGGRIGATGVPSGLRTLRVLLCDPPAEAGLTGRGGCCRQVVMGILLKVAKYSRILVRQSVASVT